MTEPTRSRDRPLDARRAAAAAAARAALAEAEALAALGAVSGPADAIPASGDVAAWATDYYRRAREALRRAAEWQSDARREVRDRAARIARRIADGARRAASVVADGPAEVRDGLRRAARAAEVLAVASGWGSAAALAAAAIAGIYLLFR